MRLPKTTVLPIAIVAVLALALIGCGGNDDSDVTATAAARECVPNLNVSLGEVTWPDIFPSETRTLSDSRRAVEQDEWSVLRGQAESRYVSVLRNGEAVGAMTLKQSQLEADFLPAEGFDALRGWVDDFYDEVRADGEEYWGDDVYELFTETPEETNVGTFCGVSYGYVGHFISDEFNRLVGYATFDRGSLYTITIEHDVRHLGEVGFRDTLAMGAFEPYFSDFIAGLSLPPGTGDSDVPAETPDDAAQTE